MDPDERVWAAIRLEAPDRVPVVPTLLPEPAAGLAGISQAEIARDPQAVVRAVFQVFDEYGGWDNPYPAPYTPLYLQASGVFPMKMQIPGRDLADDIPYQLDEVELLVREDYDRIAEMGFERFFEEDYVGRVCELSPEERRTVLQEGMVGGGLFLRECAERGLKPLFLANALHPFFRLSLMRSMVPFTQDLYDAPGPVERALERMTRDLIPQQIEMARGTKIPIWMCAEERAGAFFYPPHVFERFWWPYTRRIVEAIWAEGIVTLFHLDTCWDKNLPYFRELPRGSAVLELDGTTDLLAAKEILGGHLCLKGDVPAALLSVATPEKVTTYCRERIERVGRGGGYILGSGCSVPPNARPDNFRAMIDTAKRDRSRT